MLFKVARCYSQTPIFAYMYIFSIAGTFWHWEDSIKNAAIRQFAAKMVWNPLSKVSPFLRRN